jgi:hypothetical protein
MRLDTFGPSTSVDEDGDAAMEGDSTDDKEYDVLIRCTDGLEINFATRVSSSGFLSGIAMTWGQIREAALFH